MAQTERSIRIIEYLKQHTSATVDELARLLYVSEATIRRDLTQMQKLGQVERSHGGAILVENANEHSIFIRQTKNAKDKMRAATVALRHIPDFRAVFIDNSSTCLALVERMNFSHKTVVTNGLHIAMRIAQSDNVTLILPGGEIKSSTTAVMGGMTLQVLKNFRFDLALLSCSAVDTEGSYELSPEAVAIKRTAIENSKRSILIFDNTKTNTNSIYRTAPLSAYQTLITDADDAALVRLRAVHPDVVNR